MAFSKNSEFKYSIRGIDRIVEERGNQFIRFAQIAWAGADEDVPPEKIKYDLRKYITDADGNEKMLKGVSFLTKDGPQELVYVLLEEGFGKTDKVLSIIKNRPDFKSSIETNNDFVDLKDMIGQFVIWGQTINCLSLMEE